MKRIRTGGTTRVPKTKKHKRRVSTSLVPLKAGIAYGRFTDAHIYDRFATELGYQADNPTIAFLTRLFFAIASPEAVNQLRQTCYLRQTGNDGHLFSKGETIIQAMEALDKIEEVVSSCSIIRRYHLLSLTKRRTALVQQYKLNPAQHTRTRNGGGEKTQKVESLALQDLYYQAYNDRDPPLELQKKLKNRLYHGRNWASLAERYSVGILALLPTSKDTDLTNTQYVLHSITHYLLTSSRIERVKDQDFLVFLDILQQERGEFVQQMSIAVENVYINVLFNPEPVQCYKFEQVDQHILHNTLFDDRRLLQYCAKIES